MKVGKVFEWLKGKPESEGQDGYPVFPDDPYRECQLLINEYIKRAVMTGHSWQWITDPKKAEAGRSIIDNTPEFQLCVVHALMNRILYLADEQEAWRCLYYVHRPLMSYLLRRRLPFQESDLIKLLHPEGPNRNRALGYVPILPALSQVERYAADHGLSPALRNALEYLKSAELPGMTYSEMRKIAQRIKDILGESKAEGVEPGEPWTDAILSDLKQMEESARIPWNRVLDHALDIKSSQPSKKWIEQAQDLQNALGKEEFIKRALNWLGLAGRNTGVQMSDQNGELLKGLI